MPPTPSSWPLLRAFRDAAAGPALLGSRRGRRLRAQPRIPPVDAPPAAASHASVDADAALHQRARRDQQLAGWLQQSAAGDAEAFGRFHDASIGYAQSLARRMLPPADLEDVLSDAYFQAWREAARFDPARGSPVTWLLTLVRSRALDLLRHRKAERSEPTDPMLDERPADGPGPAELLDATESGCALHAALAGLSAQERWLLGLAYFRELTHAQVSACTGLPLGTVKSSILRAQAKLREALAHDRP